MNRLESARQTINNCDENIAKYFEARMHAVEDVIAYKMEKTTQYIENGMLLW